MNTEHSICNMHQLSPIFTQVGAHSPNNEDIDIDIKMNLNNISQVQMNQLSPISTPVNTIYA